MADKTGHKTACVYSSLTQELQIISCEVVEKGLPSLSMVTPHFLAQGRKSIDIKIMTCI